MAVGRKMWFAIRAPAVLRFGALFVLGTFSCLGAVLTNLAPTRSFVLDRLAGDPLFSADLQWVAACQQDGSVGVWNVANGERVDTWSEGGILASLPLSAELLVAAGTNITVRDLLTGRVVRRLESPTNEITSLTVCQRGNVAAGTTRQPGLGRIDVVLWNVADGQILRRLPTTQYPWESGHRGVKRPGARAGTPAMLPVSMTAGFCRAFSPDGGRFAVGLGYAIVDLWDPAGSNYDHFLGTLPGPPILSPTSSTRATELAFPDRQRLAVVYDHHVLCVLTLNPGDAEMVQGLPRISFKAKTATGELVAGEVVADDTNGAETQVRRLGLTPTAIESDYPGHKSFYYWATNAAGQPAFGRVQATNSAAAAAQVEKLGLTGSFVKEVAEWRPERPRKNEAEDNRSRALRELRTLIPGDDLEIRSIAVSGDGRRLAVAGMRMDKRPAAFFGAGGPGDFVRDVPLHGEVQVWDVTELRLVATIKGGADEKFWDVALDATGRRVGAATSGVSYNPGMTGVMQQGAELKPRPTRRVYVWELPKGTPAEAQK